MSASRGLLAKGFAALLLALMPLLALPDVAVVDGYLTPAGYSQITSVSSAVGLGTIPSGVKLTLIQCESQDVRWRDDGTNPTTSVGVVLQAGQTLVYNGNPSTIKFIETTASAKLNVVFYR